MKEFLLSFLGLTVIYINRIFSLSHCDLLDDSLINPQRALASLLFVLFGRPNRLRVQSVRLLLPGGTWLTKRCGGTIDSSQPNM